MAFIHEVKEQLPDKYPKAIATYLLPGIIEKVPYFGLLKQQLDSKKSSVETIVTAFLSAVADANGFTFTDGKGVNCILKFTKKDAVSENNFHECFTIKEGDNEEKSVESKEKLQKIMKTAFDCFLQNSQYNNYFKDWQNDIWWYNFKWYSALGITIAVPFALLYAGRNQLKNIGRRIFVSANTTTINGDGQTNNNGTMDGSGLLQGCGNFLTDHPLETATVAGTTTVGIGMAGHYALNNSKNGMDFNQSANGEEASENTGIYVDGYTSNAETTAETVSDNVETKENENSTENEVTEAERGNDVAVEEGNAKESGNEENL